MADLTHADLDAAIDALNAAGDAARAAILPLFRADVAVDHKPGKRGDFDPVTEADRAGETAIRAVLRERFPEDAITGEEQDDEDGVSGRRWLIDPIDGTKSFICGLPTWGTLIALATRDGRPVVGMMDQPFTDERYIGVFVDELCAGEPGGAGRSPSGAPTSAPTSVRTEAWLERAGARRPLRVRACAALEEATVTTTHPGLFVNDAERDAFDAIARRARLQRFGGDCYAYAMLASGGVDLVIESGLRAYDIAALIPLVEGAGGVVTNWRGGRCWNGGQVIAAGDARAHAEAITCLAAAAAH